MRSPLSLMRALIQRVRQASVSVKGEVVSSIGPGLLVFLGIHTDDTEKVIPYMVRKIAGLRIFEDDQGKMNRSLTDMGGEALVVSQFTLYADTKKGMRPSFIGAMKGEMAKGLYDRFCQELAEIVPVQTGVFGAMMEVALINDGPVTILVESKQS